MWGPEERVRGSWGGGVFDRYGCLGGEWAR